MHGLCSTKYICRRRGWRGLHWHGAGVHQPACIFPSAGILCIALASISVELINGAPTLLYYTDIALILTGVDAADVKIVPTFSSSSGNFPANEGTPNFAASSNPLLIVGLLPRAFAHQFPGRNAVQEINAVTANGPRTLTTVLRLILSTASGVLSSAGRHGEVPESASQFSSSIPFLAHLLSSSFTILCTQWLLHGLPTKRVTRGSLWRTLDGGRLQGHRPPGERLGQCLWTGAAVWTPNVSRNQTSTKLH